MDDTLFDFESIEEETQFFINDWQPSMLDEMEDVVDGFRDDRESDKAAFTVYFKPTEIKFLKFMAYSADLSISSIVLRAAESYIFSGKEVEEFSKQKDREGAKQTTVYMSPEQRNRHKQIAKTIGLSTNQLYRMCINGVFKQEKENTLFNQKSLFEGE
tara:strand:- start:1053 stop:1526 length:474 start_codon:yes stop_codon:yes gene_type:complete